MDVHLYTVLFINLFLANILMLYPLKTPENHRLSVVLSARGEYWLKKG